MSWSKWRTSYEAIQFKLGSKVVVDERTFYRRWAEYCVAFGEPPPENNYGTNWRMAVEYHYVRGGKPSFNVHPELVADYSQRSLASIPSRSLQLPRGKKCVNFRFMNTCRDISWDKKFRNDDDELVDAITFPSGILAMIDNIDGQRSLWLWVSYRRECDQSGWADSLSFRRFPLLEDGSLEDSLRACEQAPGPHPHSDGKSMDKVIALIGAIGSSQNTEPKAAR